MAGADVSGELDRTWCAPYGDGVTRIGIDAPTLLRLARSDRRPHAAHQLVAPNSVRSRALELLLQEVRAGLVTEHEALQVQSA